MRDLDGADLDAAARLERGARFVLEQHELGGVERDAVLGATRGGGLAQLARVPPRRLEHGLWILDDDERARGQVVEHRLHARVKGRRERLHAEERLALVDLLEQVARLRRRVRRGVGGGQDLGARIGTLGSDGVAHGVQVQLAQRAQRALRGRVVQAQRLDLVAVKLDAHGVLVDGGKDVDDGATHGERAGILDDGRAREAGAREGGDGLLAIERRARADRPAERVERRARHDAPEQRLRRRDEHARREPAREAKQRRHAAEQRAPVGLHLGVRRGIGRGQLQRGGRRERIVARGRWRQEERQILEARLGHLLVGAHVDDGRVSGEPGGERLAQRARGAVQLDDARARREVSLELAQRLARAATLGRGQGIERCRRRRH